jgi:DNA-binding NtrC family response regulator
VVVPPLRERPEDVPLLVEHFSRQLPNARTFSPEALTALAAYDWPGNVRELRFAVERANLLAEGERISLLDLPPEIIERTGSDETRPQAEPEPEPVDDTVSDEDGFDPDRVRRALEKARWRRAQAAELLGVSPRTLYRWMKRLEL